MRKLLGLSQEAFANQLGLSRNYVSMIEMGREPSESVKKLFEAKYGHLEKPQIPGPRSLLRLARARKGLTAQEVAREIGYPDPATYIAIEEGRSQMGAKMAEKAARLLDIPIEDLIEGGDHPPEKGAITGTFGGKPDVVLGPGISRAKFVPLLSMAQCGKMMAYDDTAYAHEGFVAFDAKDPHAFALRLVGDSMEKEYRDGDIALFYPSQKPRNGDPVVVRLTDKAGGDVMFKIYHAAGENITLTSYNPAYPPLQYKREDFHWIYPAAGVMRMFR